MAPGGSRSALTGFHDGRLRLAVAAPPEDGKANAAVRRLLADAAGVTVSQVSLVRGARSKAKRWLIATTSPEVVRQRLGERAAATSA